MTIIFEDNSKLTETEQKDLKAIIKELESFSETGQKLSGVILDGIMSKINQIESDLAERLGEMVSLEDICAEGDTLARLLDSLVSLQEWERITQTEMKSLSGLTKASDAEILAMVQENKNKPGRKN